MKVLRSAYLEIIGYSGTLRRFRHACAESFRYLTSEFAFAVPEFEATSYGGMVRFANPTTIVEVHLDWREELVLVYLRPARRSEDPHLRIDPPGVLLDALTLRAGGPKVDQRRVFERHRLREVIGEYAGALRDFAAGALAGDFHDLVGARFAFPEPRQRVWPSR